jgi:hypothetical protein
MDAQMNYSPIHSNYLVSRFMLSEVGTLGPVDLDPPSPVPNAGEGFGNWC